MFDNKKAIRDKNYKEREREQQEIRANPLLKYSTTELKKELRRRKKNK